MSDSTELITTEDAARILGLKPSTLRRWRCVGRGPAFYKLGTRGTPAYVRYERAEVLAWLQARHQSPVGDGAK